MVSAGGPVPPDARRLDVERELYRPEVFQYQRSLVLGEPVDERSLHTWWCVLSVALLIGIYGLFATTTYRPRVTGTAAMGDAPGLVVFSSSTSDRELVGIQVGEDATIQLDDGPPHRLLVIRAVPCPARRCVEVEGRIDEHAASSIPAGAVVPATVVLAARALVW